MSKRKEPTPLEKQMLKALLAVSFWLRETPIQEIQWARGASGLSLPTVRVHRAIDAAWKRHPVLRPKPPKPASISTDPDDEMPF